ncbi:MAG: F0F1 ATP synthase subunit A [Ruminococcus sp.]|jgi:F-type H+-transporting ATPase subunit a|nr:F0F1 ATP synthase subunit A [Ruminococcus sp.]
MNINVTGPRKAIHLFGDFYISETILIQWLLMIVIALVCFFLTRKLEKKPTTKRQAIAEYIVNTFNGLVDENLGQGMRHYAPYIAAIFIYAITGAYIGTLGFRNMLVDINVTGTWAGMTFILITYNNIKVNKLSGYVKGLATPLPMTPMNIISEIASPVSMALRLFANMAVSMLIFIVLYSALGSASDAIYNAIGAAISSDYTNIDPSRSYFNILQIGIPSVLSFYFDFFSGAIQSFVFVMLTMSYIKNARGDE